MDKILKHIKNSIHPVSATVILLLLWEFFVDVFKISPIIFPGPLKIFGVIIHQFSSLAYNSFYTFYESILGFLIGFLFAVLLAVGFQFSIFFKKSFLPFAIATRAIPTIAIAPIVVLWFGTGLSSKVVLSAFIAFFPILVNFMKGLNQVEDEVIDLMKTFSATQWQIFYKIRLPYSLPYLFAGLKIASSFAVIGAIIAEFIGASKGIGYLIKSSTYYSETDLTFAGIIIASLIGLIFYWFIEFIEKKVVYWDIEE
jgi:NitT/TauT family transport system permease protein